MFLAPVVHMNIIGQLNVSVVPNPNKNIKTMVLAPVVHMNIIGQLNVYVVPKWSTERNVLSRFDIELFFLFRRTN